MSNENSMACPVLFGGSNVVHLYSAVRNPKVIHGTLIHEVMCTHHFTIITPQIIENGPTHTIELFGLWHAQGSMFL